MGSPISNEQSSASPSIVTLGVRVMLVLVLLTSAFLAARGYYSHYYLVAAKRGEKSLTEYERLLRRAAQHDGDNGRARMELARLLFVQKKFETAHAEQVLAMRSFQPLTAYEQLGSIEEKMAEGALGEAKTSHLSAAQRLFEKSERVRPGNVTALEHLMLMAYRGGDDAALEKLSREVIRAQADNVNAIYVTALAAERSGNLRAAYGRYQRIVTLQALPKGTIVTTATVAQRLDELRNRVEPGR